MKIQDLNVYVLPIGAVTLSMGISLLASTPQYQGPQNSNELAVVQQQVLNVVARPNEDQLADVANKVFFKTEKNGTYKGVYFKKLDNGNYALRELNINAKGKYTATPSRDVASAR